MKSTVINQYINNKIRTSIINGNGVEDVIKLLDEISSKTTDTQFNTYKREFSNKRKLDIMFIDSKIKILKLGMDKFMPLLIFKDKFNYEQPIDIEVSKDFNSLCQKYGIKNYVINKDSNGSPINIDVFGDVNLMCKNFLTLPIKFNIIHGSFNIMSNRLVSLEGCPKLVKGDFNCSYNNLSSLDGGPVHVDGNYYCQFNSIIDYKSVPQKLGRFFYYSIGIDCKNHVSTKDVMSKLPLGHAYEIITR